MTTATNLKIRRYDLDWMRVIAILIVMFYHVGMFFVSWGYHLKNNDTSNWLSYSLEHLMVWLHQWRMPLLLLISGAGTVFATSRRTTKQFVIERHKRLFIPLLFAMFVVVPPQIYLEYIANFTSYLDFYPTVFELQSYPPGSFSWHHMWFVLYLLCYSMMAIPLINYLKSDKSKNFISKLETYFSKKFGYLTFILLTIITQVILRPYFPNETHGFFDDWAFFTQYFMFFIAGIIIASSDKFWDILVDLRKFHLKIGIVSLILMQLYFINYKYNLQLLSFDGDVLWEINKIICAWIWVFAVIGYARIYLNKKNDFLKFSNEGIYPFYILQQTVILVIAYPLIDWTGPILAKFLFLLFASFIGTVGIYLLFIKPFNLTRFLFGMKPKPKTVSTPEKKEAIIQEL